MDKILKGTWKDITGGCFNYPTWRENIQYKVVIRRNKNNSNNNEGLCDFGIGLKTTDKGPENMGVYIIATSEETQTKLVSLISIISQSSIKKIKFSERVEVSEVLSLKEGTYVVIPCTFYTKSSKSFQIKFWSSENTIFETTILESKTIHYFEGTIFAKTTYTKNIINNNNDNNNNNNNNAKKSLSNGKKNINITNNNNNNNKDENSGLNDIFDSGSNNSSDNNRDMVVDIDKRKDNYINIDFSQIEHFSDISGSDDQESDKSSKSEFDSLVNNTQNKYILKTRSRCKIILFWIFDNRNNDIRPLLRVFDHNGNEIEVDTLKSKIEVQYSFELNANTKYYLIPCLELDSDDTKPEIKYELIVWGSTYYTIITDNSMKLTVKGEGKSSGLFSKIDTQYLVQFPEPCFLNFQFSYAKLSKGVSATYLRLPNSYGFFFVPENGPIPYRIYLNDQEKIENCFTTKNSCAKKVFEITKSGNWILIPFVDGHVEKVFEIILNSSKAGNITVSRIKNPWMKTKISGCWDNYTAGGNTSNNTWIDNPQYALHFARECSVILSLRLPEYPLKLHEMNFASFYTVKNTTEMKRTISSEFQEEDKNVIFLSGPEYQCKTISGKSGDIYNIIPCTQIPGVKTVFELILHQQFEGSAHLEPIDEYYTQILIEGSWKSGTSSGSFNYPTWRCNPQYSVFVNSTDRVKIGLVLSQTTDRIEETSNNKERQDTLNADSHEEEYESLSSSTSTNSLPEIGIFAFKTDDPAWKQVAIPGEFLAQSVFSASKSVSCCFFLDPDSDENTFTLMPAVEIPDITKEINYSIRIFIENLSIEPVDYKVNKISKQLPLIQWKGFWSDTNKGNCKNNIENFKDPKFGTIFHEYQFSVAKLSQCYFVLLQRNPNISQIIILGSETSSDLNKQNVNFYNKEQAYPKSNVNFSDKNTSKFATGTHSSFKDLEKNKMQLNSNHLLSKNNFDLDNYSYSKSSSNTSDITKKHHSIYKFKDLSNSTSLDSNLQSESTSNAENVFQRRKTPVINVRNTKDSDDYEERSNNSNGIFHNDKLIDSTSIYELNNSQSMNNYDRYSLNMSCDSSNNVLRNQTFSDSSSDHCLASSTFDSYQNVVASSKKCSDLEISMGVKLEAGVYYAYVCCFEKESISGSYSLIFHSSPSVIDKNIRNSSFNLGDRRNKVIQEIFLTEKTYVKSLNVLVEHFMNNFIRNQVSLEISINDIKKIFGIIPTLLNCNNNLYEHIKKSLERGDQNIGHIFEKFSCYLKMYAEYTNYFDTNRALLESFKDNPAFKKYLETLEADPKANNLYLADYYIIPVQRIPRYTLLLERLLKYTPRSHSDYGPLSRSCEIIRNVASEMNEKKKRVEALASVMRVEKMIYDQKKKEHITLTSPSRLFVRQGELALLKKGHGLSLPSSPKIFISSTAVSKNKGSLNKRLSKTAVRSAKTTTFRDSIQSCQSDLIISPVSTDPESGKILMCFLFNDLLLLTEPKGKKYILNTEIHIGKETTIDKCGSKILINLRSHKDQSWILESSNENIETWYTDLVKLTELANTKLTSRINSVNTKID